MRFFKRRQSSDGLATRGYEIAVILVSDYCGDETGHLMGPPEDWSFSVVSYSFFFGLALARNDRLFAEGLHRGMSTTAVSSGFALTALEQVAKTHHESLDLRWHHAVQTLCTLVFPSSPETFGPTADERLVKQRMGIVGLTPGVRLGLERELLARHFEEAADYERERCPLPELFDRINYMKRTVSKVLGDLAPG